jgi:hypothetical protein
MGVGVWAGDLAGGCYCRRFAPTRFNGVSIIHWGGQTSLPLNFSGVALEKASRETFFQSTYR